MYVKLLSASLLAATVMFSGCGDDKTTCRIDVQKAIDEGRYDSAISDLEGRCATAYTQSDLNMNLAAAYMGKSGYGVSDIINMVINSGDNGGDAFTSFLTSVDEKKTANSLPLLTTASDYYAKAIEKPCSAANLRSSDDPRLANACLYIGFNETIKAANTITYLTGDLNKTIESINSDSNSTPNDMRASLDALAWAVDAQYAPKSDTNISASDINISGYPFADINVTYDENGVSKVFYRLAKSTTRDINNTTVITDGYCDADGNKTACEGIENADGTINLANLAAANCYACPVVMDANNTLGVAQLLVDTLNGGSDTIVAVSGDPAITDSIDKFKKEITGDVNGTVTIKNIIQYLQK